MNFISIHVSPTKLVLSFHLRVYFLYCIFVVVSTRPRTYVVALILIVFINGDIVYDPLT